MPARKRAAEAKRRERERLVKLGTLARLAEDETDPTRRRVIEEEMVWADREPCVVHCSCGSCCYCGVDVDHDRAVRAWHSKLDRTN